MFGVILLVTFTMPFNISIIYCSGGGGGGGGGGGFIFVCLSELLSGILCI